MCNQIILMHLCHLLMGWSNYNLQLNLLRLMCLWIVVWICLVLLIPIIHIFVGITMLNVKYHNIYFWVMEIRNKLNQ